MNEKIEKYFVLFFSIVTTSIVFGLSYGVSNQNTYLIHGLVLIDPNFLSGDWFAHSTQHYHDQFSSILLLINHFGLPIPASLIAIEVTLRILALVVIYKIICLITNRYSLLSFMVILFLIVLEKTRSVAGSYIFSSILQPSSFGSVFLLVSFLFFLRGSYFVSGLSIAFAGLMHTNFLILGFIVFGIAHLFLGIDGIVKRVLLQFFFMIVILAMKLPFLLDMMSSELGEDATYIFQFIRSPHHYLPNYFLFDFLSFCGWSFLGLAGIKMSNMENRLKNKFLGLYFALLIVLVISTLLTTVVFIPVVSKLFFWRMAPFSVLLSQILFVTALVSKSFSANKESQAGIIASFSLILLGYLLIFTWYRYNYGLISISILHLSCLFVFFGLLFFRRNLVNAFSSTFLSKKYFKAVSIAMLSLILIYNLNNYFISKSTLLNGFPGTAEIELYQWVKTTNKSTVFLTPPNLQNFRLHGERAIIVDWKSTPIDPKGLIEWYIRIQDITGLKEVSSSKNADKGYLNMNRKRLVSLTNRYDINYAVLYRDMNIQSYNLPIVFKNKKFMVIALESL